MSTMPQLMLETYPSQILWCLFSFGLLYLSVRNIFLPRLFKITFYREDNMQSAISEARELFAFCEQEVKEQRRILDQAHSDATRLINDAKTFVARDKASCKELLEEETKFMLVDADEVIHAMISSMEPDFIELSVNLVDLYYRKVFGHDAKYSSDVKKLVKSHFRGS